MDFLQGILRSKDVQKIYIYIIVFIVGAIIGAGTIYLAAGRRIITELRDSRANVAELTNTNRELSERNRRLAQLTESNEERLRDSTETIRELKDELGRREEEFNREIESLTGQLRSANDRIGRAEEVIDGIRTGLSETTGDIQSIIKLIRQFRERLQSYFESS